LACELGADGTRVALTEEEIGMIRLQKLRKIERETRPVRHERRGREREGEGRREGGSRGRSLTMEGGSRGRSLTIADMI
jgi:hypothetical protein